MKKQITRALSLAAIVWCGFTSCGDSDSNLNLVEGYSLSEFSSTEFPADDDSWVIADQSAMATSFEGLKGALKTISYDYPSRKISLEFPNMRSIPAYAMMLEEGESKSALSALVSVSSTYTTSIGEYAFYENDMLLIAAFPNATTVGDAAFGYCSSLCSVSLSSAESLGKMAFRSCTDLSAIVLSSVIEIGDEAFYGCSALSEVTLPATLTVASKGLFAQCSNLYAVELAGATTLGNDLFEYCSSLESVTAPCAVNIGSSFRYCASLQSVELATANGAKIESFDQPFYGTDTTSTTLILGSDNSRNVVENSYLFDPNNVVTFAQIVLQ